MDRRQADEIAELLNSRNQLTVPYTAAKVLAHADDYVFQSDNGIVVACVEVKAVQWYQSEIYHLSVKESHEGRRLGTSLIRQAEEKARRDGARIAQCTIRVGNEASEAVFRKSGYREACRFLNARSGNQVAVWQKALNEPERSR